MSHSRKAIELFNNDYNCCQAVLGALHYELHIDYDTAINIGAAFGGGIGRQGLTCGAVSAAYMAIGLHTGKNICEVNDTKAITLNLTKKFNLLFIEAHGSLKCNQLLNADISTDDGFNYLRECGKFKTHCPKFVETATNITIDIIKK